MYRVCAVRIAAHKAFREFYFSLDAYVYLCLHVCVRVCRCLFLCVSHFFNTFLFVSHFVYFIFFGNFRNQLKAKPAAYFAKNSNI